LFFKTRYFEGEEFCCRIGGLKTKTIVCPPHPPFLRCWFLSRLETALPSKQAAAGAKAIRKGHNRLDSGLRLTGRLGMTMERHGERTQNQFCVPNESALSFPRKLRIQVAFCA
jgi:hypothetical protein